MNVAAPAGFEVVYKDAASRPDTVVLNVNKGSITVRGDHRATEIASLPFHVSVAPDGRIGILSHPSGQFKWGKTENETTGGRNRAPVLMKALKPGQYEGQLDSESGWWIFTLIDGGSNGSGEEIEQDHNGGYEHTAPNGPAYR